MNTRTTALLALVCVAVFAYLLFVVKPFGPPVVTEKPQKADKTLLDPKPEGTDRVEVSRRDGKSFVFVRDGKEDWKLDAPIQAPASKFEVDALVEAVTGMKVGEQFDKGDKRRPSEVVSGLDKPLGVMKLLKEGKLQAEVKIGSRVPTGKGNYVQLAGGDTIHISDADLSQHFTGKRIEDYRDKRVLKFEFADIQRVKVEGMQNYELVKADGDQWMIESPVRTPADKGKADGMVRPLTNLRADEFLDDEPASTKLYGLDSPRLRITVETRRTIPAKAQPGDPDTQPADTQPTVETKTYVLSVGGSADLQAKEGSFYAQVNDSPSVFTLRQDTLKSISPTLTDIRDKAIVRIEADRVRKVEATTPEGAMTLIGGEQGQWRFSDGTEADDALVNDLVKAIGDLKATDFVDPGKELLVLDWEKPRARYVLTQEGQLNPVTVLVGPASASGKMVYVRNPAQEGVAAVPEASVAGLLQPPVSYRDRSVLSFNKEDVVELRTYRTDMPFPPERVVKADGKWLMIEPVQGPADEDSVRNLIQDLASLPAKQVVSIGDKAKFGLDKPTVIVSVTLKAPGAAPAPTETPAAGPPATTPASLPASGPERDVAILKQLIEYQETNPEENPKATEMLKDMLAQKLASMPADAAAIPPAPKGKVYELHMTYRDNKVYGCLADGDVVYELDEKVYDDARVELYQQQVLKFDPADVIQLAFRSKGIGITVSKAGDQWKYLEDPMVQVDALKVTDVLNAFKDLKTYRYADFNATDLGKYGLAGDDVDRVSFSMKDGSRIEVLVSQMSPPTDQVKTSRYAMIAGDTKVFQLHPDQAGKFRQRVEDFQKK
ncbi:MAG TPA: DUF4340 domain-containing protein [Phycisphaerae bacterium]|nr:DUF4340 domain-containing protein [Phycisphaerae bacterium]